jgi:hypothetical protein
MDPTAFIFKCQKVFEGSNDRSSQLQPCENFKTQLFAIQHDVQFGAEHWGFPPPAPQIICPTFTSTKLSSEV